MHSVEVAERYDRGLYSGYGCFSPDYLHEGCFLTPLVSSVFSVKREFHVHAPLLHVHLRNLYGYLHADLEFPFRFFADEHVLLFREHVVIVFEARYVHEPLDEVVFEFHEESETRYPGHYAGQDLACFVFHELDLLEVHYLAFRLHGVPFPRGRMRGYLRKGGFEALPLLRGVFFSEGFFEEPVDHEVGVAPYGRGEVGIVLERESEVPQIFVRIHGLPHRAEQHVVDEFFVRGVGGRGEKPLEGLRRGLFLEPESQSGGEFLELGHACRVGRFVNPVNERIFGGTEKFRDRPVGGEHEFLDYPVGDVPFGFHDVHGTAFYVYYYLRLRKVEVYGALFHAPLEEFKREFFHSLQVLLYVGVSPGHGRVFFRKRLFYVRVCEPLGALYDAFVKRRPHGRAVFVEFYFSGHGQAFDVRVQARYAVRYALGEHGYAAVGKVNARASLIGLFVEVRAFFYVVAHVGYGDEELVAERCSLY